MRLQGETTREKERGVSGRTPQIKEIGDTKMKAVNWNSFDAQFEKHSSKLLQITTVIFMHCGVLGCRMRYEGRPTTVW
jgi:hypothetical protein